MIDVDNVEGLVTDALSSSDSDNDDDEIYQGSEFILADSIEKWDNLKEKLLPFLDNGIKSLNAIQAKVKKFNKLTFIQTLDIINFMSCLNLFFFRLLT